MGLSDDEPVSGNAVERGNRSVCFLTSNFPRWEGDSTTPFVLHLAQDLVALGWDVEVLAPHAPGAARQEVLGGVRVFRFRYLWPAGAQTVCYQGGALINLRRNPINWLKVPALVLAEAVALWRLARRRHYDVIHAHWILPQGFVAVVVGRFLSIPVGITVHGGDVFALQGRILRIFKAWALRKAVWVTFNSAATGKILKTIAPDLSSLHLVPMGAALPPPPDPTRIEKIREAFGAADAPLLIFVGRLVEEKGLADLLEAVALLTNEFPALQLLVLGEGQERPRFEALAETLNISCGVHFLGWIQPEELTHYLRAADVLVAPSKTGVDGWAEGQGLTVVEALLHGLPVVATKSGGIVDLIEDGVTGLLVEEGAPAEIARAVKGMMCEPEFSRRLGDAGFEFARQRFTRDASAAALKKILSHRPDKLTID